jgi:phage shock protein PspC (stress-responsive transcriptional regulator)
VSDLPEKYRRGELARRASGGLYRDPDNGKAAGICTGLAQWSRVPAVAWRLGFVLGTLFWGVGIPIYVILWLVMDERPDEAKPKPTPDDLSPDDREIWDAVRTDMDSLEDDLRND